MEDIGKVATNYFENMFHSCTCDWMEECLDIVPQRMTTNMLEILSKPFSVEEVKIALFQIGPTKALGPDAMNPLFTRSFGVLLVMMLILLCWIFWTLVT